MGENIPSISCLISASYLIVTDFNVLFHHNPCHCLSKRRSGQGTCVCPIVIDVLRKETCRVEFGELYHTILDDKE